VPIDDLTPRELDHLIMHLRKQGQRQHEPMGGGYQRQFKSDACLAADYLEAMRAELPHWQHHEESV
jgi:hypothetical protein